MATGMKESKAESLNKILRQERANGFQDKAVIGGLDRFLRRWWDELRPVLGALESYSLLTPEQRKSWADTVMAQFTKSRTSDAKVETPIHKDTSSRPKKTPARARRGPTQKISLQSDVTLLKGVSSQNVAKLRRLGVEKVRDLVYLFPRRHNDFANIRKVSQLQPGQEQTLVCTVWEASETGANPRRKSTQAILGDETGNVRAIWFNQPWLARTLRSGTEVVISGKVNVFRGQIVFESPEYELVQGQEELVHTGRLVPVYPSTDHLPQRTLRRLVKQALDAGISEVSEFLPDDLRHRIGLPDLQRSVAQMHYPDSIADWKAARRRLAFDELFLMQLAILTRKRKWQGEGHGIPLEIDNDLLDAFLKSLPFSLTDAQDQALSEILDDLKRDKPMSRLLQGDVGSGKTVVALAALLVATFNNYQAAFMVPTEILAEQHFITVSRVLSGFDESLQDETLISVQVEGFPRPITIGLLLGSLSKKSKYGMHRRIADGAVDIIIGTHALIQSSVDIPKLALAVVDEQHRFGVMQRSALREKGGRTHLLSMSATPIPRSLTLTLYGDQDISAISELPPGRQQIRTRWLEPDRRGAAYHLVDKEIRAGRQAFIVCPLIEESEVIQSRAATEEHERLSTQVFPDLRLGLLHGRLALREKEQVMEMFQQGELDILVSTPVVEVGIDVPNATVMLIDGADRFGLAQLHQFRGRVGRGEHQSYCLLLSDSPGGEARERLRIMERIQDGFQLAEEDLKLRGPGDYLGTRQSGIPDLRVASITDQDILSLARREAIRILEYDPELSGQHHAPLSEHMARYAAGLSREIS